MYESPRPQLERSWDLGRLWGLSTGPLPATSGGIAQGIADAHPRPACVAVENRRHGDVTGATCVRAALEQSDEHAMLKLHVAWSTDAMRESGPVRVGDGPVVRFQSIQIPREIEG